MKDRPSSTWKLNHSALPDHILEEASQWFVDFSEADVDSTRRAEFDAWLRRSPEHVRAYLQIAAFWEEAGAFKNRLPSQELIDRALKESNVVPHPRPFSQTDKEPSPGEPRAIEGGGSSSRRRVPRLLAFAATFLVLLAATWLFTQRNTYATGIGEQRSLVLTDGSTIELNSRSRIKVRFNERERIVELQAGQALFKVAKDHTRPFIVDSNGTKIRAVGTQFDIYRRGTRTVVTVLEGKVAVSATLAQASAQTHKLAEGQPVGTQDNKLAEPPDRKQLTNLTSRFGTTPTPVVYLAAGEQLTATPSSVATPQKADLNATTAWTRRQLIFQGTPLSDATAEFNRYNTRQIVIRDPTIASTRISGIFSSTDPSPLIRFLKELPNIQVDERSNEILITQRP